MAKIKCKLCAKKFDTIKALREHFMGTHRNEAKALRANLKEFDDAHPECATTTCTICEHRGSHSITRGKVHGFS